MVRYVAFMVDCQQRLFKMISGGVLQFIIFLVFGIFILLTCAQENVPMTTFWNSDTPGALLQNLNSLTSRAFQLPYNLPIKSGQLNAYKIERLPQIIQERSDFADSYEDKSGGQKIVPYDYDKAYDEFVKKYFSDAVSKYSHVDNDYQNKENRENPYKDDYKFLYTTEDDHESFKGDTISALGHHYDHNEDEDHEESEPISEASRKHFKKKKKKCKSVKRNRQKCLVCKNPRTGENSETCEYNNRKSPQNYSYKKEKNYSKYHSNPNYPEQSKQFNKSHDHDSSNSNFTKNAVTYPTDSTKCNATTINNKICYCKREAGEQIYKCQVHTTENAKNIKNKRDKNFHQRIHKRTVSFTVENTHKTN